MDQNKVSIHQELYPEKYRNYLLLSVICLGIAGFIEGPMNFLNFNKNDHMEEWLPQEVNDFFAQEDIVYYTLKFVGPVFLCIATGVAAHMHFQAVRHNYKVKWVRWIVLFFSTVGFIATFPVSTLSFEITNLIGGILTFHSSGYIPSEEDVKVAMSVAVTKPAVAVLAPGVAKTYNSIGVKGQGPGQVQGQTPAQAAAESYKKLDTY